MNAALKSLVRLILGDYDVYRILAADCALARKSPRSQFNFTPVSAEAIKTSEDEVIRAQQTYMGTGTDAFACMVEDRIVGICFFWHGERYQSRNYWPLASGQAKLVQIITVPDMRGKGVARGLIEFATARMLEIGFERLLARVWLTNESSRAAFVAAGWRQIAVVVQVNPLRRQKSVRFTFGERPASRP